MLNQDAVTRLNAALEGRYRIERRLGEGGMATVYLARDERHNRNVALKVLKPELAAVIGAERFLAEIETTANLQHPHILPLFDSGEADGFLFYVMPYVEGESLRERLDRERQLPVDEAVEIASDVAEALGYAHRHGVIHRDIKPANILLQDGKPVVSDFGIALAVSGIGKRLTETGLSLGTPQYMSPEQATGDQAVGPAADIWAVACVLYEMLVGEPPYGGSTPQAILGKVVAGSPESVAAQRRTVSHNVEAAIERGLEKVPADRFGSAEAFAEALADPAFRHRGRTAAPRPSSRIAVAIVAASAFLAGGMVFAALTRTSGGGTSGPEARPVVRFKIPGVRENAFGRVVAISRDGSTIAHANRSGGLALRDIDASDVERSLQPNGGTPFFSPDGTWLAYFSGVSANLTRTPVTGGTPQLIASSGERALGGSWGTDDNIVFATTSGLYRVPAEGGETELLAVPDAAAGELYYAWPDLLPGGRAVLFTIVSAEAPSDATSAIAVLDLESREHRVVFRGGSGARYSQTGHLVYSSGAALYGVGFDVGSLEVIEEPVALDIDELALVRGFGPDFDISDDGTLVYMTAGGDRRTLLWIDRDGTEEPIPVPPRPYNYVRVSPDGGKIAVDMFVGPNRDLYVWDLRRATLSRLTNDPAEDFLGHWSPDGRRIFFTSERNGVNNLYAQSADGTGQAELVVESPQPQMLSAVSSDGTRLVTSQTGSPGIDIVAWTLGNPPRADTIVATEFREANPVLSPDERWVAFSSDRDGRSEIYVTSFPDADRGLVKVSIDGGRAPLWSRAGDEIYFLSPSGSLMSAAVRLTPTFEVGDVTELIPSFLPARVSTRVYDVSPVDGRFLTRREVEPVEDGGIVVVVNWAQNLLDRLPSR